MLQNGLAALVWIYYSGLKLFAILQIYERFVCDLFIYSFIFISLSLCLQDIFSDNSCVVFVDN